MKTIYNTYVEMESQEQCDRMKQLCIDNFLSYGEYSSSFELIKELDYDKFYHSENAKAFFIGDMQDNNKITEQEFIELLKNN